MVFLLVESETDLTECYRKLASGRKLSAIRIHVKATSLQLECARVLNEIYFMSISMYGSEIIVQGDRKRSKSRAIQIDGLK